MRKVSLRWKLLKANPMTRYPTITITSKMRPMIDKTIQGTIRPGIALEKIKVNQKASILVIVFPS